MLPIFPRFKKLHISDKQEIKSFINVFPPYSDFNFVSLWVWSTKENIEISNLNENLVVKFQDYITNGYFYSFIGNSEVTRTIKTLLSFSKENKLKEELKLLPESNFNNETFRLVQKGFCLVEDKDNYDYILDVKKIAGMEGNKLHQKRKMLNHFLNKYPYEVDTHMLTQIDEEKVMNFFLLWEKLRKKSRSDTENEFNAMKRLFINPEILDIMIMYLKNENDIVGYTIFEIVNKDYAVSDFQKADLRFEGANEMLTNQVGKYLYDKKCMYLNIEQDLGIPGLKRSKLDYDPTFLKKYIINNKI